MTGDADAAVRVRVPGTSANLGPGFDALGVAITCWNEFTVTPVDRLREDAGKDLPARAFAQASRMLGFPELAVHVTGGGTVPRTRGLGSSSTCVVAGVLAAAALRGVELSERDAVDLATRIEGHPDNVAPAVLGGVVAAAVAGERTRAVRVPLARELPLLALIPDVALSTEDARAALPDVVSRADAVFNLSRAALLVAALASGDRDALSTALDDRLHQPYRARLIPGLTELLAEAGASGAAGAWLSGAGPTVMVADPAPGTADRLSAWLDGHPWRWEVRPLAVSRQGAAVVA